MNEEGREVLTALIVQFERQATTFLFLRLQCEYGLLSSCSLQSIKHVVECPCQFCNFCVRRCSKSSFVNRSSTDGANGMQEAKEGAKAGTQEQNVHQQAQQCCQHNETCIDQVMVSLYVMAGYPQSC